MVVLIIPWVLLNAPIAFVMSKSLLSAGALEVNWPTLKGTIAWCAWCPIQLCVGRYPLCDWEFVNATNLSTIVSIYYVALITSWWLVIVWNLTSVYVPNLRGIHSDMILPEKSSEMMSLKQVSGEEGKEKKSATKRCSGRHSAHRASPSTNRAL